MKKILSIFIMLSFLLIGETLNAQVVSPEIEEDITPVIDVVMSPKGEDMTFGMQRDDRGTTGGETTNDLNETQVEDLTPANEVEESQAEERTIQEKRELLNEVLAYPNPANYQLTVQFKEEGDYTLYIYNLLGQVEEEFWVESKKDYKLDVSTWQEGVYLLQIVQDQEQITRRIKISR